MSNGLEIHTGDRQKALVVTLYDSKVGVNLDQATSVRVLLKRPDGTLIDRTTPDISWTVDAGTSKSTITMPWQAGDTDGVGVMPVQVKVVWPGGLQQTFEPPTAVHVKESLDD